MAQALSIMGDLFASPSVAFAAITQRPRWALAAVFICMCSAILSVLLIPFSIQIIRQTISDTTNEQALRKVLDAARSLSLLGAFAAPAALSVKWIVLSGILYATATLLDVHEIRFNALFAIVVHVELIQLLMGLLNLSMLTLRGLDSIRDVCDLCAIPGLLTLINAKALSRPLLLVLANTNLFTIWYLVLLSQGYSILTGIRAWKSGLLVSTVLLLGVGFEVAVSQLMEVFH